MKDQKDDNRKANEEAARRISESESRKSDVEGSPISFDIDPFAGLEEEELSDGKTPFASIPKKKLGERTVSFREALISFGKEIFSKPKNYAYMGILCLLVIFIARIQPLSMDAKERLIAMLPPELELLKPAPEPEPEPPSEEKIEPPIEKPKKEIQKPEEQKVPAVESEETSPDLPSAFGDTNKEELPSSLSQVGKVFETSDLDEIPKIVFKVEPKYPELARRAGKEGLVILRILITKTGEVGKVIVVSAPAKLGFEDSAVEAVRRWKFKPPTVGGTPVDVWSTLPIRFKLE